MLGVWRGTKPESATDPSGDRLFGSIATVSEPFSVSRVKTTDWRCRPLLRL